MSEIVLRGVPAADGVGIGTVVRYERPRTATSQSPLISQDAEAELTRLAEAVERTRLRIEEARAATAERAGQEEAAIFDAHLLFLDDPSFVGEIERRIQDAKMPAEVAIEAVADEIGEMFAQLDDPYLRARSSDIRDVATQLLQSLAGEAEKLDLASQSIIIAEDLLASDTALLDVEKIVGFATRSGSPTAHVAILARALDIPLVIGIDDLLDHVQAGQQAIVDGTAGELIVNPAPASLEAAQRRITEQGTAAEDLKELRDTPAITRDGERIHLHANIGTPIEARAALENGAEGIGLFRTEFLFLDRPKLPDEEEQYDAYRQVAAVMGDRPVIIRTLDAGGDKPIPGITPASESNPFLGVRGIRLTLAHPEIFRTQIRALLRAASAGNIWIMFPMVATVDDLRAGRQIVEEVSRQLRDAGVDHRSDIPIGIMVEVPSAAIAIDQLIQLADFVSIGTNDLVQYTLAVDRTNAALVEGYSPMDVSVLRLIRKVLEAAKAVGKHAGICGEMAGDLDAIPTLIGLGARELSMGSARLMPAKRLIHETNRHDAEAAAIGRIQ